jgi:hypothetical protein
MRGANRSEGGEDGGAVVRRSRAAVPEQRSVEHPVDAEVPPSIAEASIPKAVSEPALMGAKREVQSHGRRKRVRPDGHPLMNGKRDFVRRRSDLRPFGKAASAVMRTRVIGGEHTVDGCPGAHRVATASSVVPEEDSRNRDREPPSLCLGRYLSRELGRHARYGGLMTPAASTKREDKNARAEK